MDRILPLWMCRGCSLIGIVRSLVQPLPNGTVPELMPKTTHSTTYCYAHDECDALRFIKNVDENIRYELFSGPQMHTDTDKMHVRIREHLGQTMVPTTAPTQSPGTTPRSCNKTHSPLMLTVPWPRPTSQELLSSKKSRRSMYILVGVIF